MRLKKLISIASIITISLSTACAKKTTATIPYPTVNNNSQALGDTQNFLPYQQPAQRNQSYYENNAQLSDDTSAFDQNNSPVNNSASQDLANAQNLNNNSSITDIGNIPDLQPYNPNTSNSSSNSTKVSYTLSNNFPVDQDKYVPSSIPLVGAYAPDRNQWQAVGIAVSGSKLVISAYDKSGLFKKGTIITMDSSSGKNWKNIGSAWLGTRHPMDATVKGVAIDNSNNIYAADSTSILYNLKSPKYSVVKVNSGFGSNDIAILNDSIIISTSSGLKKTDSSLSNPSDFAPSITSSTGIGTDNNGNLYVVSGSEVKKVSSSGTVSSVIKGLSGAIDVTANGNNIFVLTADGINIYDKNGKSLGTFGQGELLSPQSIASDAKNVYVADSGSSQKDSQILVYSNMAL
jgi:hypothetical protein